ncbi:MAG TPA: dTDP-4-dehydrorhamnose reductase [Terracidiphilus sp.]|nr:dTDP-4-dehydrorhamnose reductase [Terracidiphilus sp.]
MKIAVVGANGQLGSDIVSVFGEHGDNVVEITHAEVELANTELVRSCIGNSGAQMVINTAAMHNVERCEQQPDQAFAVNAIGARNLALVTREMDAVLVHISTDYVFDGAKSEPYVEEDAPLPLNVYGNSKLAGECFVRTLHPKHFVLRTSAIYGKRPCRAKGGLNFVELMLKLGRERGRVRVVNDEFVSPTPTIAIARQVAALKDCKEYGLYHATAEGSCSWHQYAKEIFATAGLAVEVDIADSSEFPAKVPRPRYSVLENRRLKAIGLNVFPSWETGLAEYLNAASMVSTS